MSDVQAMSDRILARTMELAPHHTVYKLQFPDSELKALVWAISEAITEEIEKVNLKVKENATGEDLQ